jgi:hypothetical protein
VDPGSRPQRRAAPSEVGLPKPPPGTHTTLLILGGDGQLGRDEFLRVLYGGRVTLEVALGATLLAVVLGIAFGAAAGYFGGWIDAIVSRFVDLVMTFPLLLFLLMLGTAASAKLRDVTLGGLLGVLDMPLMVGVIFVSAVTILALNLLIDLTYSLVVRGSPASRAGWPTCRSAASPSEGLRGRACADRGRARRRRAAALESRRSSISINSHTRRGRVCSARRASAPDLRVDVPALADRLATLRDEEVVGESALRRDDADTDPRRGHGPSPRANARLRGTNSA